MKRPMITIARGIRVNEPAITYNCMQLYNVTTVHSASAMNQMFQLRSFCSQSSVWLAPPVKVSEISNMAVAEIAQYVHSVGGKVPLASIISAIGAKSKDAMFRSGKGVEGFVKAGSPAIDVIEEGGMKFITSNIIGTDIISPATKLATPSESAKEIRPKGENTPNSTGTKQRPKEGIQCPLSPTEMATLTQIMINENSFRPITEVHKLCRAQCALDAFSAYVNQSGQFWINGMTMKLKKADETSPLPQAAKSQTSADDKGKRAAVGMSYQKIVPSSSNNFGGWGSSSGVPTAEDVYEILKYVPIHWGNMGALNLPTAVKKKHIRIASFLLWLRRQPKYFEVRNIAGTLEVRRAVPLHPEQHGKTQEEADQWLAERISSGEHNGITGAGDVGTNSLAATAIYKFLIRVTPGYFVAPELLFMRYTKKGLTPTELSQIVKEHPSVFETVTLPGGFMLIRRRTGADSSKWRDEFVADCCSVPSDIGGLFALMGRSSVCWDRPEYLYVRLLDKEKIEVGGYEGMLALMKRHPLVFKMGDTFFKRVDHSDPTSLDEIEPTGKEEKLFKKVEENVYHGHRDIALIFHYVSPDDSVVNIAQLNECASPAIQAELPPRIVSILQMFPDLFHCKETAPGVFSIRKVVQKSGAQSMKPVQYGSGFFHPAGTDGTSTSALNNGLNSGLDDTMDDMLMGDDDTDAMTRKETVEAVKGLIPARGVEIDQLAQWLSMSLRKNVATHFETLPSLLHANMDKFSIDSAKIVTTK